MISVLLAPALVMALVSCATIDRVRNADGEVYDCGDVEYCYLADSADELSDLTGLQCSAASIWDGDRLWPSITNALGRGCTYACPAPKTGCNAQKGDGGSGGCFCPGGE